MPYFADYFSQLAMHREFDPKAFIEDDKVPKYLCSFILALALAYNNYKYIVISFDMLEKSTPQDKTKRNPECGEYEGINYHLHCLHIGFIHELFKLIQNNKRALEHPFFAEIIRVISKGAREAWKILLDEALSEDFRPKKSNPLFMARNKVAFHYDAKELFRGYNKGFFDNNKIRQTACISTGDSCMSSRFYFADVAVQAYLEEGLTEDLEKFTSKLSRITKRINFALYDIVVKFIQRRGFAWRDPK